MKVLFLTIAGLQLVICSVFGVAAIAAPTTAIRFTDVTQKQPFTHQYTGGWEHFVGGGLAAFDCNDDGFADAYVAGGDSPAKLLVNSATHQIQFTHLKNNTTDMTSVIGAYPIDIDSDNITDLAVLRVGENVLLRGLGDCEFENANERWKFQSEERWTTAFSATWEAGANGPTLAFGNYVDRSNVDGPFGACDTNTLYRWNAGRFESPRELSPGYCSLSMLFSDWRHQGKADLRVSNDRHYYLFDGHEQMWNMQDDPVLYTEEDGWQTFKIWGMGIAARDINNDGLPDYLLTSMSDQKFQVLKADSNKPEFVDEAFARGMIAHRPYFGDEGRPSTAWHAQFGDVNNDGLDDLFIAKGNVDQMPDSAVADPNNLLMQDSKGHFYEVGQDAGIADVARSRGAALEDFNNDGQLDLLVVNRREDFRVYQNTSSHTGNWLAIDLSQGKNNTAAIGAWIALNVGGKIIHREITVGGGHAGGSLLPQHFGLAENTFAKAQITWPDNTLSEWLTLESGVIHRLSKTTQ